MKEDGPSIQPWGCMPEVHLPQIANCTAIRYFIFFTVRKSSIENFTSNQFLVPLNNLLAVDCKSSL
jgi:hypothetical protein